LGLAMDHITQIIAAAAGLLGVLLGGLVTAHNQKKQRVHDHIQKQLSDFYSPLLGIRARILAKSEVRLKVSGATGEAWRTLVDRGRKNVESLRKIEEERFPDFEKVLQHDNRQLVEELIPLYRKMIDLFTNNMWLAEGSTRVHFGALVEFVEIWDRWLGGSLPKEAVPLLGHREEKLQQFYIDLVTQLDRLTGELKR
jgi:hypothetical protein